MSDAVIYQQWSCCWHSPIINGQVNIVGRNGWQENGNSMWKVIIDTYPSDVQQSQINKGNRSFT